LRRNGLTDTTLITGGAGFIGSHLADRLIQRGSFVKVYDNLSRGTRNIDHLLGNSHFELIAADLVDGNKLLEALEGCSVVYHLAANPEVRIAVTNTNVDFEQNLVATRNVLEAMKESEEAKTIVFTSTSTVYGDTAERPTPEDYGSLVPISLYGATKLGCEALISAYSHLFDLRAVIYRFANVVGPRSSHGVIYDFIQKLRKDPSTLEILGDGTQSKSYLYIDDCVDALLSSLQVKDQVAIFNVGTNDQVDVKTIAEVVAEEMGLTAVTYSFAGGFQGRGWRGDVKLMLLDATKLRKLGWKPKLNSKEAIQRTVRSMILMRRS
jgi:UDP-glucose 4-epimerase